MLGIFSGSIVSPPDELVAAGSRTPSPKTKAAALLRRFIESKAFAVSVQAGEHAQLAYTHHNESPCQPRSFAVKDEVFCLFEGALDNLGSLRQQYGLAKSANEVLLVIEAYKALRDRAPYPANHVVGHLSGSFAFIVFDKSTSTLFVAVDQDGKVPLYWGITADGNVAFADDAELLKGACGKSLASFPQGCFYSTRVGGLRCYENPKNKITAVAAKEEEIWGATFKVGIYGYAAYSASKFALRGLAEALQQEVIADNIHVSLIFPPDTDTPGYVEENKRKPELTKIIAASSGAMKADEVAQKAIDGIKSGSFFIPCNLEGLALSIATAGLSPQRSLLMAFVEVVAAGILRIAALCFQWSWYDSIEKWHIQRKSSPRSS